MRRLSWIGDGEAHSPRVLSFYIWKGAHGDVRCPEGEAETVLPLAGSEMIGGMQIDCPIVIEIEQEQALVQIRLGGFFAAVGVEIEIDADGRGAEGVVHLDVGVDDLLSMRGDAAGQRAKKAR